MSNDVKKMHIFDGADTTDKASLKGTQIILKETGTGKPLFRGSNKVLATGSEFNALKDFLFNDIGVWNELEPLKQFKSYDDVLDLKYPTTMYALRTGAMGGGLFESVTYPASGSDNVSKIYERYTKRVFLFCVGIDGCGIENSRVYKVHNTKWIAPTGYANYDPGNGVIDTSVTNCLIPFRVVKKKDNLSILEDNSVNRRLYFGQKSTTENSQEMISYYFKSFDSTPTLIRRYADDSSELSSISDIWKDTRLSEAEIVVQLKMSISPSDCREYFELLTGTNNAKINTLSLCTAVPYTDSSDGSIAYGDTLYYRDIKPFTKFNFPNESLINTSKGIDITYYLYY